MQKITNKDKVIALYNYISKVAADKTKTVSDYKEYPFKLEIETIPHADRYIKLKLSIESGIGDSLLKIKKPDMKKCPAPPDDLKKWLESGWDKYVNEAAAHKEFIGDIGRPETIKYFKDNADIQNEFNKWADLRDKWAETERRNIIIKKLFDSLYRIHNEFKTDSESNELIIANGIFNDSKNQKINHPLVTRRLKTVFDADNNEISLIDTDVQTELYSEVFKDIDGINNQAVSNLELELRTNDYFPTGTEIEDFLKRLSNEISSDSAYIDKKSSDIVARFTVENKPVIILRKRVSGIINCIESIKRNIDETGEIPDSLLRLVDKTESIEEEDTFEELSVSEKLAAVCGESEDILLSKEANLEQLKIAKLINENSAVIVQGPPGTGKTHTIANLIGHLLSQGKSVLVTSHTKKALSVLKDKVEPGIRDLCVSMIEDSNKDMKDSIENIAEFRATRSTGELKQIIRTYSEERQRVIADLSDVRERIYQLKNQEQNTVICGGREVSPSAMADFVRKNKELLEVIPGKIDIDDGIEINDTMPLTMTELENLYSSNEVLKREEEESLSRILPEEDKLMAPERFAQLCKDYYVLDEQIKGISKQFGWNIYYSQQENRWVLESDHKFYLDFVEEESVEELSSAISYAALREKWQYAIAAAGKDGRAHSQRWETLIESIEKTCDIANTYASLSLGKTIEFKGNVQHLKNVYKELSSIIAENGKIPRLKLAMHSNYKAALEAVLINGETISSKDDCKLVVKAIDLNEAREECARYWDELFSGTGVRAFSELDDINPETAAEKWIYAINECLNWNSNKLPDLVRAVENIGISFNSFVKIEEYSGSLEQITTVMNALHNELPALVSVLQLICRIYDNHNELYNYGVELAVYDNYPGSVGKALYDAVLDNDYDTYESEYDYYKSIIEKDGIFEERKRLIKKLESDAPQWAASIKNRSGIHGYGSVPENIQKAWQCKQYKYILDDMLSVPYDELLEKSVELSSEYRSVTRKLAEVKAWYSLLTRMKKDSSLAADLEAWKYAVQRIGKGTGKNAPKHRKAARDLMGKCQRAVPCWIMTVNKAIETLKPSENRFDVIIVDEASQSDLTALAVAYMAEKIVIVGDDKQVSPMGIGVDTDKHNAIVAQTIEGIVPYCDLIDVKTSLYSYALMSYKPIMLKEHFRCVPDIIGYSNKLSYGYKIQPLRDSSSSNLLPAMVPFRVHGIQSDHKTNEVEAKTIVALIKACIDQEEYKGKTFGVISLLGDEQAQLIYQKIASEINPVEIENRQIICGNPSHFQGDERDVIFLSMVYSNQGEGPLRRVSNPDGAITKRYNVAVSRAKDQIWIVHSLDPANDLQPDDLRKDLLDYAGNPSAFKQKIEEIAVNSESPFEEEVARRLVGSGYHIVQQWEVGAYRLDMVAICNDKKVAIECDGERWHSGEEKIYQDMERQTILERIGWSFIRIRGSEFYSDKDAAIERVIYELAEYDIYPENTGEAKQEDTELLNRIKKKSAEYLGNLSEEDEEILDLNTISVALSSSEEIEIEEEIIEPVIVAEEKKSDDRIEEKKPEKPEHTETAVKTPLNPPKEKKVREQKTPAKKGGGIEQFISSIKDNGWELLDNRETSDIIWVIYDADNKELQKKIIEESGLRYAMEKRGTIATGNRRAWRIMTKKEK